MAFEVEDSRDRFKEGLTIAVDRCRMLSDETHNNTWKVIAVQLKGILNKGSKFIDGTPLTRQQALNMIDDRIEEKAAKENGNKSPKISG